MSSIEERITYFLTRFPNLSHDKAASMVELEASQVQIQPTNLATLLQPRVPEHSTVTYILQNYGAELSAILIERDRDAAKALYDKALKRMRTTTQLELLQRIPGLGLDGDHPFSSSIKVAFEGTVPKLLKRLTESDAERVQDFPEDQFRHANIVDYRIVSAHGRLFMLMENLNCVLDQLPTFDSILDCDHFCSCVLQGLQYLHSRGFGHFDVKGSNICITSAGDFKLIDLGSTARLGVKSFATTETHVPVDMPKRERDVYVVTEKHDLYMLACTLLYKANLLSIPSPTTRYTMATVVSKLQTSVYASTASVSQLLILLTGEMPLKAGAESARTTTLPPI